MKNKKEILALLNKEKNYERILISDVKGYGEKFKMEIITNEKIISEILNNNEEVKIKNITFEIVKDYRKREILLLNKHSMTNLVKLDLNEVFKFYNK